MSAEEMIEEGTGKRGLNLNVKMSPGIMITIIVTVIGGIISITRFADTKTSREDVEHIFDTKIERVEEKINGLGESLDEIKNTLHEWKLDNAK